MEQNNQYYYQAPEPDYYTLYTNSKVNEAKWTFSRYFLALFLYLVISNVVVLAAQIILIVAMGSAEAVNEFLNNNIYIQWLLGVGPMYLVGFPIFYLIIRKMKKVQCEKKKLSFKEFMVLFLICEGAMYIGNYIGTILNSIIGAILNKEVVNSTAELIENSPMWLIILIVVVIGPIVEELLFRKFMIDRIGRYGDAVAITTSAIAFGLFHGNFFQFFYAAAIGFVLGYIYTSTRDVKYTIIMHMVINFLGSIIPMLIQDEFLAFTELLESMTAEGFDFASINMAEFLKSSMVVLSYSFVQYALTIGGIILFILALVRHKIKLSGTCEYIIPKNRVAGAVIASPGTILFLIFSAFQLLLSIIM